MVPVRHAIYLHGFASSPRSSKAERYARELGLAGVGFSCPDFNVPAFEALTVTRMLAQTREAVAAAGPGPIALIGSSLGAFVALHAAAENRAEAAASTGPGRGATGGHVDRLILLAPALDFGGNRLRQLGEQGIEEWRTRGFLRVFHYGLKRRADVGFALYEDAARYDALTLDVPWPMLVFQGARDASVDPAMVSRWAGTHPAVDFRMVNDEHQLTESMDDIWRASRAFLGLPSTTRDV